jgi:hypothetical protein
VGQALGCAYGVLLLLSASTRAAVPRFEDFAGAESCARCHPKQFESWKDSTHGRAGGLPGEAKFVARFDGQPLRFKDAVVTPARRADGNPVFRVAMEGLPPFEIPVDAVVGGAHMAGGGTQSFFNRHPDGTVRFLPFDFIRREDVWFVQLRADLSWAPVSQEISLRTDLANWPPHRVLGTVSEFSNCQNCHGSQITAGWDEAAARFTTRFTSLRINCESCHGPARRHLEIVSQPGFEKKTDLALEPLTTLSKEASVQLCLACHATKEVLRDDPFLPGAPMEDYFSLKLPVLGQNPYHPDGRISTFSYQGNHLFSDCYRSGSMTCVDCHDPHTLHYRDAFGRTLPGRFSNGQCTACHASKAAAPERHSHHAPGSTGQSCVACHMPYLQHPAVGQRLQFARSDHTIPIPRPAFDQKLGIENACQKCHADHDLAWQERWTKEWWGTLKPHPPAVANQFRAAGETNALAAAALLLTPGTGHAIAETAALAQWLQRFLRAGQSHDPRLVAPLTQFARSADPDLRALGLLALDAGFREHAPAREFLAAPEQAPATLPDAVRRRWSVAADTLASRQVERGDFLTATQFLHRAIAAHPGNFVAMSHLALACLQSGDAGQGIHWLESAVRARPNNAILRFQLGQTLARLGRVPEAIQSLEAGLRLAPDDPAARRLLEQLRGR